jgi:hypothetical protein
MVRLLECPAPESSALMPTTALVLPAELIRRVADEIVNTSVVGLVAVDDTRNLWPLVEVLSQCSLTCRYWCGIFRQYIFYEITLHSHEEIVELAALIESSHSNIAEYIEVLRVEIQGKQTAPWLHHVFVLRQKLPNCKRTTLDVDNPLLDSSVRSLTTLHPLLPTTVPAYYSDFASLVLSTHRFNDFTELLRLVRRTPALEDLTCSVLTWNAHTPVHNMERPLRFSARLRDVSTVACQDDASMLWLLTTDKKRHAHAESPLLSVHGMAQIVEVITTLLRCGRTRDQPQAFLHFATSMHVVPPFLPTKIDKRDRNFPSQCEFVCI